MLSLSFFRSVELHVPTLLYYTLYLLHCLTLLLESWIQGTPLIGPTHHSSATELHHQYDAITILSYLILFYPNSPPLLILFSLSNFNSYPIPSSLTPIPTPSHPLSPQHLSLSILSHPNTCPFPSSLTRTPAPSLSSSLRVSLHRHPPTECSSYPPAHQPKIQAVLNRF